MALIPVGSVEGYGRHLPLGTDGLVAVAIARRLADRLGCFVAPLVPVGWTAILADFPGTLSVSTDSLKAYCKGVALSLFRAPVAGVVFVNGHAGNIGALDELCYELRSDDEDRFLACINVWHVLQSLSEGRLASTEKFGHAGELNTSVMLHLYPDLVHMDQAQAQKAAGVLDPSGVVRPYRFSSVAPNASLGDPALATAEKGRDIVELAVDRLVEYLTDARGRRPNGS